MRGTAPRAAAPLVPHVAGTSLLGLPRPDGHPTQRYVRTGPIPVEPTLPTKAPTPFTRKREAALAAAALAVVGAMSGAAALLPSGASNANAATRIDPVSAPIPRSSGGSSNSASGLNPQQLKHAMRAHHSTRSSVGGATLADVVRTNATARATPPATAAATARPSTSAPPSASPSPSASSSPAAASTVSSTSPLGSLPALIGALPLIPSALLDGTYTLRDFLVQSSGSVIAGGRLRGAGVGRTVVEMQKDSSTKASSVPGNGNNQGGLANPVNPLYLLRGVSDLEDVTIQGTEQGHLYNGVYMTGSSPTIKHVQVNDIPGNSSANPGETFAIGVNRASGTATVDDLTINGGTGSLASAAGLAINNSAANWNIDNLTTRNLRYSAGIALWQVHGTFNIRNWTQSGGARSLGAERMAGTVNLYDPKWSAGTIGHDITYTWDGGYTGGSINFYYSSASQVPNRKIQILTNKAAGIANSVHVYIGGVEQNASNYVTVN
ncbi:hypothetical protein [Amnibacterium sp.]|uniref:hypothetical protein n=1 Tax=Amnibacterium sp. TaxID=1872496 RepID=UPI003F7BF516